MRLKLLSLDLDLSVCKLSSNEEVPKWVNAEGFFSVTQTDEELSIVCPTSAIPTGIEITKEDGWKAFKIEGVLDFSLTGILKTVIDPLAEEKISVFTVSTYNTDYVLVKKEDFLRAKEVLAVHFDVS